MIRITPNETSFFLSNNESKNLIIKTEILTNPFCSVRCNYSFSDLSKNKILDNGYFSVKPTLPLSKEYTLTAPEKGTGQEIYRYDIKCKGVRTLLCHTGDDVKSTIILITLNYDLDEKHKELKKNSKESILSDKQRLDKITFYLELLNNKSIVNNNLFDNQDIEQRINSLNNSIFNLNNSLYSTKEFWEKEEFDIASEKIDELNREINNIEEEFYLINSTLYFKIIFYNSLLDNMTEISNNLKNLQYVNLSNNSLFYFDNIIQNFNDLLINFNNEPGLYDKENKIYLLSKDINFLNEMIEKEKIENITLNYNTKLIINSFIYKKIEQIEFYYNNDSNFFLKDSNGKCCLFGFCQECCDESCKKEKDKFPLVLIHGHDFSKSVSAEYSLNSFDLIQIELEKEGYLNVGSIFLGNEDKKGILGYQKYPISVRASYYFDNLKSKSGNNILQTKQDNIDTYAIRLNDIIKTIKFKTNRDKVIVITHSMGGLVLRRYLQIFGEGDVEKAILIASPNKGIDKDILKYCLIFGSQLECNDMDKDSLFMNKLNNQDNPKIPIDNIIGIGCKTNNETGDGIVKNSSAYLEFANNYYVNGTCDELKFDYLHSSLLNPDKYPKVLAIINQSLRLI